MEYVEHFGDDWVRDNSRAYDEPNYVTLTEYVESMPSGTFRGIKVMSSTLIVLTNHSLAVEIRFMTIEEAIKNNDERLKELEIGRKQLEGMM